MDRDELQLTAAKRLSDNKRLICQWATGVGKSKVAIQFLAVNQWMNCLILVPEQNNIQNWKDEFNKFGLGTANVTITCYASLHKYTDTKWDLLVLDEVPHMDTEKRIKMLQSVSGEYVLALGAVVDQDEMSSLEFVYGRFDKSIISLPMAINMNLLPIPQVMIMHLKLDNTKRNRWYRGKQVTEKEQYDIIRSKVEKAVDAYNLNATAWNKRQMLTAGSERKRFLGELKQDAMRGICAALESQGKRFICFCSSIKQANELGGDKAFTSQSAKSIKHLEKFNNHEIDSLYVVGKCIEGQNLKDIDCGVIGQLGGTQRITVQELGRIMRSENPLVFVPVFDDTKDDSFLFTLTSSIPAQYIKHYNFK